MWSEPSYLTGLLVTVHGVKRKDHCPLLRRLDNGLYVLPRGAINNLDPYLANTGGE